MGGQTSTALRRRRPSRSVMMMLALASLLVAAVGVVLTRAEQLGRGAGHAPAVAPAPAPAPAPPSPPPAASPPLPDPAALDRALRGPLSDPGFTGAAAVEVRDLTTGALLLDHRGQVPDVPASTAKLLVAAVALSDLGADTRLQTRVYAAGDVLYLVGGGDPTLTRARPPSRTGATPAGRVDEASVADLAGQVRAAGVRRVSAVVGDARLFSGPATAPGWRPYYLDAEIAPVSALTVDEGRAAPATKPTPRTTDPVARALSAFRDALSAQGMHPGGQRTGPVPPGARLVASVDSPPVSALVEHMLTYSDNDLAEALGRLVARHRGRPADFAGASAALLDGLREMGLPMSGVTMRDTSGLSHDDRVPPALLVEILRRAGAGDDPALQPIVAGLPVAGRSGTLADRYRAASTRAGINAVRAKTGRLAGVAALAGLVRDRDGRTLAFAVRAPATGLDAGEQAVDRVAAALAQCGCRG